MAGSFLGESKVLLVNLGGVDGGVACGASLLLFFVSCFLDPVLSL